MSCERNPNKSCDIGIENADWNTGSHQIDNVRYGSASSQASQTSGDICRICHCENDANNPLLTPCYCSGSLKYVHQTCLQQWLTASETNACELCKFPFIMHTKIKPFCQWRGLDIPATERRRLWCSILFHCAAALCVIWSLCVLIERAADDVKNGFIDWPFWTKLAVVAVGLTGGIIFMYIQCKAYLHLCHRWKARNRILLIQNVQERVHAQIQMASPHSHESNSIINTDEKRYANAIYTASRNENRGHTTSSELNDHHHPPSSVLIESDDNSVLSPNSTDAGGIYSIPNSTRMSNDKSLACATNNCMHHCHHRVPLNKPNATYNSQEVASLVDATAIDAVSAANTAAVDNLQLLHCKQYCDIDDILQTDPGSMKMTISFHNSMSNVPEYLTNTNMTPANDFRVDTQYKLKCQDLSKDRRPSCEHQHFSKLESHSAENIESK